MPKTKPKPGEILIAVDTGVIEIDGTSFFVYRNKTRVRADHPIAKSNPGLFKPIDAHYEVEQTTANSGEQRGAAA